MSCVDPEQKAGSGPLLFAFNEWTSNTITTGEVKPTAPKFENVLMWEYKATGSTRH